MLSKDILEAIESGKIVSRRQLYVAVGGRSKNLRLWLDANDILVPQYWDLDRARVRLRDIQVSTGRLPKASDDPTLTKYIQNKFGTWNKGLFELLGEVNQRRYIDFTNEELLQILQDYVDTFSRIPLRSEFDGRKYPYFEVYFYRFSVNKWSQVIKLLDLPNRLHETKHGWGRYRIYNGQAYLSHQEYLIGKWLTEEGIEFEKEVPYGNSPHIFDFQLTDFNVYIEYYGIHTEDYVDRIEIKRSFYAGRKVIEIFKHDNTIAKLAAEVQRL
mgnify:FL=1